MTNLYNIYHHFLSPISFQLKSEKAELENKIQIVAKIIFFIKLQLHYCSQTNLLNLSPNEPDLKIIQSLFLSKVIYSPMPILSLK